MLYIIKTGRYGPTLGDRHNGLLRDIGQSPARSFTEQ